MVKGLLGNCYCITSLLPSCQLSAALALQVPRLSLRWDHIGQVFKKEIGMKEEGKRNKKDASPEEKVGEILA